MIATQVPDRMEMYVPWLDGFPGFAGAGTSRRGTSARLEPGAGIAGRPEDRRQVFQGNGAQGERRLRFQ